MQAALDCMIFQFCTKAGFSFWLKPFLAIVDPDQQRIWLTPIVYTRLNNIIDRADGQAHSCMPIAHTCKGLLNS